MRQRVSLPIIANGEIWSVDNALRCRTVTGCTDLMLGRGALCRPDLPRLIAAATADGDTREPLVWDQIIVLLVNFFELTLKNYDAHCAGNPLNSGWYTCAGIFRRRGRCLNRSRDCTSRKPFCRCCCDPGLSSAIGGFAA